MNTPPPSDGGGSQMACDYTPKANALASKLRFQKIDLKALPMMGGTDRGSGYNYGITEAKFFPGSSTDFFIMRKTGNVYHYRLDAAESNSATLIKAFMVPNVRSGGDTGLLSVAFDPQYDTNKFVFFGYAVNGGGRQSVITRFNYDNNELTNPQRIIDFTTSSTGDLYHSIGSIGFEKGGVMWALHGDWNMTPSEAQNGNSVLGKLIRIVPSRAPAAGGYEPAPGNPNMSAAKPGSAVYALGLRSPWRGAVDSRGRFIIGDIGPSANEKVNLVTRAGQNFNWPMAGCGNAVLCFRDGYEGLSGGSFDDRQGRSVWVGPQYGNCGNDRYNGTLTGVYFFGDFFTGWVAGMLLDDAGRRMRHVQLATFTVLSSWDQAADGYLYVSKFGNYSHEGAANEQQGLYRVMLEP